MRVVICWAGISGYMAACWRALAATPGVDLLVVVPEPQGGGDADFKAGPLVEGYTARLVSEREYADPEAIARIVGAHTPDIVVLCGWAIRSLTRLPFQPDLRRCRFVMAIDTPWRGTLRQRAGGLVYGRYFRRIDRVVVTGERAFLLARAIGFGEDRVRRGCYGIDYDRFQPLHARRAARPGGWPRRFLFIGRYAEVKGIGVMLDGFRRYRAGTPDPWTLATCGQGPLRGAIAGAEGVRDLGFIQPADLPAALLDSGALVLASRFDPWPLVIVEACAAGLPIVCTEACGSGVDLVRTHYNGMVVPTGDADALARAMRWVHDRHDRLAEIGGRSLPFAAAFSAQVWAERWAGYLRELT